MIAALDPTTSEIGSVVLALAVILLVLERGAALTRMLWGRQIDKPDNGIYATKLDISRIEQQITVLATDYRELIKTTFERYDTFNKTIADMRVSQEVIRREIREEVGKLGNILLRRVGEAEKHAIEAHKHGD